MVEELFICGMFSPLGELLTIYYLAEEYSEIVRRVFEAGVQADSAARAVLGISFEELGIGVARHWQFPPAIVNALAPLPPGKLPAARDPAERMWHCAVYARELGVVARINDSEVRASALEAHIERFAESIPLDAAKLRELMARSAEVAANYIAAAGFSVSKTAMLEGMGALCAPPVVNPVGIATQPKHVADLDKTLINPASDEPAPAPAPAGWSTRIGKALRGVF